MQNPSDMQPNGASAAAGGVRRLTLGLDLERRRLAHRHARLEAAAARLRLRPDTRARPHGTIPSVRLGALARLEVELAEIRARLRELDAATARSDGRR